MRLCTLAAQRGPLFHTETMLLVYDRYSQVVERDILLDERVRAHGDVNSPSRQIGQRRITFSPPHVAREKRDPDRLAGTGVRQVGEHTAK